MLQLRAVVRSDVEYGPSRRILEKPPVPLIQQLDALIEADTNNRVAVGFQMIASESVQRAKQLIVEGKLGDIQDIRAAACWSRTDSYYNRASWSGKMTLRSEPVFDGPATNALAHLIHNIMFLASPQRDGFDEPIEVQGELYRARPTIQSYDTACLRGRFESGTVFVAAFTHATEQQFPFVLEVHGSKDDGEPDKILRKHRNLKNAKIVPFCHDGGCNKAYDYKKDCE